MKLLDLKFTTTKEVISIILLLCVLQIPSIAPIVKYVHLNMFLFIPCYLLAAGIFYYYLFLKTEQSLSISNALNSSITLLVLLGGMVLINVVLYQHELALQALGRGSDGGEALIISGQQLLLRHFPYLYFTHLHNPISPGPGWVILTMIFTCTGTYALLVPVLVITSVVVIKKVSKNTRNANFYLLCLFSSPAFWQAMVTGNDYIAIGLTYSLITIALFYSWHQGFWIKLGFIICAGMLATARLNFWYLAPLLGFFIGQENKKEGVYFAFLGLLVTLILHLSFIIWDSQHYTPLHVIGKGNAVFNAYGMSILILACMVVGMMMRLTLKHTLKSWLFFLWLCLTTPLLVVMLFTLIQNHGDIFADGLGYIILTAPILVMCITIQKNLSFHQ